MTNDLERGSESAVAEAESSSGHSPGKRSLTAGLTVQRHGGGAAPSDPSYVQPIAEKGVSGGGGSVPFRDQMEQGFGMDFSSVSFHAGPAAASASKAIGAEAYTMGSSIAMAATPTPSLVAHELAHVVQQGAGAGPSSGVGAAGDRFEREADHAASTVSSGGKSDLGSRYGAVSAGLGGAVQQKAVQRYESGEHAMLGAGPSYPAGQGDLRLDPSGAQVFRGEMVAFADFYSDLTQMAEAPRQEIEALAGICRLEAVWYRARQLAVQGFGKNTGNAAAQAVTNQVATGAPGAHAPWAPTPGSGAGPATPEANHTPARANLESLPHIEGSHAVWSDAAALVGGVQLGMLRQQIFNQFTAVWALFNVSFDMNTQPETGLAIMRATIGRRRFRGTNDSLPREGDPNAWHPDGAAPAKDPGHRGGDYLDLAQNNLSHFTPDNYAHWKDGHDRACTDHASARDDSARNMALVRDSFANHFLTDRFSTGHFVDKAELMSYATKMMVGQAKAPGRGADAGESDHTSLARLLRNAVNACFDDPNVVAQWSKGVDEAVENHAITAGEGRIMRNLPANTTGKSIAAMITGVLMEMPWRSYDSGAGPVEPENGGGLDAQGRSGADRSRGQGPNSKNNATASAAGGDYQLGVGNLAALQVHDALNAIGFTVANGRGQQWRSQGDDHLTPQTELIANDACETSKRQVVGGRSNPDEIKQYLPSTAWIDPAWIADYFQGRWANAELRPDLITKLQSAVRGPIDLNVDGGHRGANDKMTDICHKIMDVLFTPVTGPGAQEGDHNTGLNISMLKAFLVERLPEMVSMAYAATSAADIPQQALELYAPLDANHRVLPRSANDFHWVDDTLFFDVNDTGCTPGQTYTMVAKCFNQDSGYDVDQSGLQDYSVLGSQVLPTDTDANYANVPFQYTVPGSGAAAPDPNTPTHHRFHITVPKQSRSWSNPSPDSDDRYVVITGDAEGQCNIGRSENAASKVMSNSAAGRAALPKATGPDATSNPDRSPEAAPGGPAWVGKATTIHNEQFKWTGNTVSFRVEVAQPPPTDDQKVMIKIDTFDWELIGSNRHVAGPEPKEIAIAKGSTVSDWIHYTCAEDNDGDIFVKVQDRNGAAIGESRVQGKSSGHDDAPVLGPKVAKEANSFVWSGNNLRFRVTPADADPVYVKFMLASELSDVAGGVGSMVAAAQLAGTKQVKVESGNASANAGDVGHNIFARVYRDADCHDQIGESENKSSFWPW